MILKIAGIDFFSVTSKFQGVGKFSMLILRGVAE